MTPLGVASSYWFCKQRNRTSFSKWIIECAHDKELYSSLTAYSSSSDSQNFRPNITLLHRAFSPRLQLLARLEFCYETSVLLCPGNGLSLFRSLFRLCAQTDHSNKNEMTVEILFHPGQTYYISDAWFSSSCLWRITKVKRLCSRKSEEK